LQRAPAPRRRDCGPAGHPVTALPATQTKAPLTIWPTHICTDACHLHVSLRDGATPTMNANEVAELSLMMALVADELSCW
jgi:hypothetical protein